MLEKSSRWSAAARKNRLVSMPSLIAMVSGLESVKGVEWFFCNNQYSAAAAGEKTVPLPSSSSTTNFFEAFYSAIALTESEVGWRSCNDERLCAFLLLSLRSYRAPAYLWRDLAWKLVVHIMSILAHDSSSLCSTHREQNSSIPFSPKKNGDPTFYCIFFLM